MKLIKLDIKNIKGVEDFVLVANGEDCTVYGSNGTGKSTIKDSLSWLLFDKSADDKKFNPKTVDSSGNEIPMLDHQVVGVFDVDGEEVKLSKLFKEKWTNKRGSNNKSFTGHTTDYEIDDVPVKKKQYVEKVGEIADQSTFKLLSDVDYFAGKMAWKDRRELVMEICGDIADEDVIKSDSKLSFLGKVLGKKTVADYVVMVKSQMKKINEKLKSIPARVDEATRAMFTTDIPAEEASAKAEEISVELKVISKKIDVAGTDDAFTELENNIREITTQIGESELADKLEDEKIRAPYLQKIADLKTAINQTGSDIEEKKVLLKKKKAKKSLLENDIQDLTQKWHSVNDEEFRGDSCPTCKREYDMDTINEMLGNFNEAKSERLAEIISAGKPKKAEIGACENDIVSIRAEIDALEKSLEDVTSELKSKQKHYDSLCVYVSEKTEALRGEKALLMDKKINWKILDTSDLEKEKEEIEDRYAIAMETVAGLKNNSKIKARVEELKEEEVTLSAEYEQLEGNLFLTEEFTRKKVEMVESNVSKHFNGVRFKMLKEQINGGLDECCEVMVNGVQYNHGLNSGAKINAGIDIINTLSKHFGANVPLIIDNAESTVSFKDCYSQLIRLNVSGDDDVLRVV